MDSEARSRSLRSRGSDRMNSSKCQSVELSAAVLSRRSLMEQPVPFMDARVPVRGTDEIKSDILESLVKHVSSHVAGYGGESSPASTNDTTPGNREESVGQQPGLGVGKRSGGVDFGSLEIVEFEMEPELAERTVVKRVGEREAVARVFFFI